MVKSSRHRNGTNQIEDGYYKVSDKKSQVAAEAEKRTGRGSTRRRFRTIEHRKSSLHTKNRREESVPARDEENRG